MKFRECGLTLQVFEKVKHFGELEFNTEGSPVNTKNLSYVYIIVYLSLGKIPVSIFINLNPTSFPR